MDTEISYRYKDGLHTDIKQGYVVLDKGVFKKYTDSYGTKHDDTIKKLNRRLWYCHLRANGDHHCKMFLNDIADFWKNSDEGFVEKYEESEFKKVHEFLIRQELIEILFYIR